MRGRAATAHPTWQLPSPRRGGFGKAAYGVKCAPDVAVALTPALSPAYGGEGTQSAHPRGVALQS